MRVIGIDRVLLSTLGGSGTVRRRKSLVHRLILNDQTFLSPQMTSVINEISTHQKELFAHLSCSTPACLRNQSLTTTRQLLNIETGVKESRSHAYLKPLESPFPFLNALEPKNSSSNPLRMKFYQQPSALLPENLPILLTLSPAPSPSLSHEPNADSNRIIEYLTNFAYTKWNGNTNQYQFDRDLFHYHQTLLAPLLRYAKHVSNDRHIHLLERCANKYHSELPYTLGYVLAPSMSVFNDTYLKADEQDRRESMKIMDLFANLLHNG